jgi:Na+/proline symporter
MSTADSQLLVAASSVVRDIYEKILCRDKTVDQQNLVLLSRVVVFILVLLAIILGLLAQDLVFWMVLFAWAGLGAALGPTSILALYWKKTTRSGIIAGLITGTITTIIWYYIPLLKGMLYELIPAFIVGLLTTFFVSKITTPPKQIDAFFTAMNKKV